jgi:arabinogalactan endo-1,4-beta-galactosidase
MPAAEQADWGRRHLFGHVGSILAAMAQGIRKADPKARVMTHLGGLAVQRPEVLVTFFEAVEAKGFRSEALGTSFYPTAFPYFLSKAELLTDRFTVYKQTAQLAKKRLGKPLYIAEWGYPAGPMSFGGAHWDLPVPGYPISAKGQSAFLRDLVEWGVRTGTLAGIRPWAPDFVGGGWQPMALFGAPEGGVSSARDSLSSIQEGLRRARR